MEKRLFTLINAAQHRMFKFAELESEKRIGLTVTQSAALMFIAKNEGCQQKALADATGLNQSAVTGLISRMKKNGLIERKACADDGRASNLYLSEKGRQKLPEIFPLVGELNERLTANFNADEIDTVARFLNNVIKEFK